MTTLEDYSLNLPEEEYHNYPAWSYSILAKYARGGFSTLPTLFDKIAPTKEMEFGSLFDAVITQGKKALDKYIVYDKDVPSAEQKVLDELPKYTTTTTLADVPDDTLIMVTKLCQYYPKWGIDAKRKHLEEYADYYTIACTGKKVVSSTDWNDVLEMEATFRSDPFLKELFGTANTKTKKYLYQKQYVINYTMDNGDVVPIKIMPDLIKIDHEKKEIQPTDLKTSSNPAYDFKESFVKLRYDLQASLYSYVISVIASEDPELKDYTINPYLFVDISRTDKVPVTYVYDQNNESQKDGLSYTVGEKTYNYAGWQGILREIRAYQKANAKVPSYITTNEPNDLINLLNR